MKKILLDTDIGSDLDDSVCLAYLLCQPQCDLLGITTVSGESDKRAMMADAMCKVAGKDIPVFAGAEEPLLTPQLQPIAKRAALLDRWPHKKRFPKGEAVEFMRQTIRKHPHEVTLLGIGPMTNIAALFAVDPEIPHLLKDLVVMCGIFTYGLPVYVCLSEWNARCDPYAAAMMYNAPVKNIRSIGLDVTTQVTMPRKDIPSRFTGEILRPVVDFADVKPDDPGILTFHDPLAAATIFDDGICTFERGDVTVELESSRAKGLTYWSRSEEGKNEVAFKVDAGRFFDHYFHTVQ